MADYDFENPTVDPDGPGIDDELRDAIIDPLLRVQRELYIPRDIVQSLQDELRETELEDQTKRLVTTFYQEVNHTYGLRLDSIDYDQFRIDADSKTLYWTPGDKTSLSPRREEESGSWRYNNWPRGMGRVVQMHCGDRWDSLDTLRGKVLVAPL